MSTTIYKNHTLNDFQNYPNFDTERALQLQIIDEATYTNAHYGLNSIAEALDYLLYSPPSVTATVTQAIYEKGQTATTELFQWVPVYSTDTLNAVTITDVGAVPVITTSHTYSNTLTNNKTYTVLIADSHANTATASATVYFNLYKYYGQSASAAPTPTIIKAFSNGAAALSTDAAGSQSTSVASQPGGGNYIYFAYPQSWGLLTTLNVNGFGSTWNLTTPTIVNGSGNSEVYNCYTSPNTIAGSVSLLFA